MSRTPLILADVVVCIAMCGEDIYMSLQRRRRGRAFLAQLCGANMLMFGGCLCRPPIDWPQTFWASPRRPGGTPATDLSATDGRGKLRARN